jgi:hypothetical protein
VRSRCASANHLERRLTVNRETRNIDSITLERSRDRLGALRVPSRYQQRTIPQLSHQARQIRYRPSPKDNAGRGREFESHHQPSSPGKIFWNSTLLLGSAIISATASRQAA